MLNLDLDVIHALYSTFSKNSIEHMKMELFSQVDGFNYQTYNIILQQVFFYVG